MNTQKQKPLKRHPALVPLSRDHHFGLLLCWKIRTGISKQVDLKRIVDYVVYFYNDHLKQHFFEEEKYIFVWLNENDEKRIKAENQHKQIADLVDRLTGEPDSQLNTLRQIESVVDMHIRFEERDLFPYVQQQLNEADLEKLRIQIEEIHQNEEDKWDDPFWEK